MGTAQPPKSQRRFAAFVRMATPPIPHRSDSGGGAGRITLAVEADAAVYEAIRHTARLLITEGTSYRPEVLEQYDPQLHEMAQRFTRFLATGDAPWP